jgi:hypothetical protein
MTEAGPDGEPASGRSPAQFGWSGRVRMPDLWNQLTDPDTVVAFRWIVAAWYYSMDKSLRDEALAAEKALRRQFIRQNGRLVDDAYYTTAGGCALTEQPAGDGKGVTRTLHIVLKTTASKLVEIQAECYQLMMEANAVFGRRRSPALQAQLVVASEELFSVMTRVLRLADMPRNGPEWEDAERAAMVEIEAARRHVRTAIQREAGFMYFTGMLIGVVVAIGLCALLGFVGARFWPAVMEIPSFTSATVFGALGAMVSVFQRLSADKVVLAFAPSQPRMLTLGGLRPLVGATLGAVAYLALVGGVLGSVADSAGPATAFGLAAVTGFAAGFTERFAADVVQRATRDPAARE